MPVTGESQGALWVGLAGKLCDKRPASAFGRNDYYYYAAYLNATTIDSRLMQVTVH